MEVVNRVVAEAQRMRGLILEDLDESEMDRLLVGQGFSFDLLFDEMRDVCELVELNGFGVRISCGSCLCRWVKDREQLYGGEEASLGVPCEDTWCSVGARYHSIVYLMYASLVPALYLSDCRLPTLRRLCLCRHDTLRIMEDIVGIHSSLDRLQLGQMLAPVFALRLVLGQLRIRVVDVLTPVALSHARSDVTDKVLHAREAVGRKGAPINAVVEVVQEQVVTVSVGC